MCVCVCVCACVCVCYVCLMNPLVHAEAKKLKWITNFGQLSYLILVCINIDFFNLCDVFQPTWIRYKKVFCACSLTQCQGEKKFK